MEECLFCKIIKGEIPSTKVYEDNKVYAFLDIAPVNKGHTLVIPKDHAVNILDIKEEDLDAVSHVVRKLVPAIKQTVNADGINVMSSNGKAAGQVIMHSHIHIIPRFENDGLNHWPQGKYEDKEADNIKEKIVSFINE